MRRIWALAAKDLRQTRRDKLAALFTVIMPVAFTAFLGIIIGGADQKYPLAVADGDRSALSRQLIGELRSSKVVEPTLVGVDELDGRVADQKAVAGLLIPRGFGAAVLGGETVGLDLVRNAGSAAAQSALQELNRALSNLVSRHRIADAAVSGVRQTLRGIPSALSDKGGELRSGAVRAAVEAGLGRDALAITLSVRVVQAGGKESTIADGFVLTSTGMIVNFILFSLMTAGMALIDERRNGTLQRLLMTRARRSEMIAGKVLGMFILTFVQQVVLITIGAVGFGVGYFNDPAALLLVMISLSVVVSCLGLLLATLLGSEQALVAASVMVSMAWSALSGGWFPLEITGSTFSAIGHVLPTAWILDAFRGIILKGWHAGDVLPALGVAFAWGAGLFALATWRFRTSA